MKYTSFGKVVKKLMIEHDENLSTLSNLLNVTKSFVSAVFVGKKSIPDEWYDILCEHYNLDNYNNDLFNAFCENKKIIKINVSNVSTNKKKLALQFKAKLSSLSQDQIHRISEILGIDVF